MGRKHAAKLGTPDSRSMRRSDPGKNAALKDALTGLHDFMHDPSNRHRGHRGRR
jgi:hypothetical protein